MEADAGVLRIGCRDLLFQPRTNRHRTALKDRTLPHYTAGEERFNYISHIAGAVFGVMVLVLCVVYSVRFLDTWAVVGSFSEFSRIS